MSCVVEETIKKKRFEFGKNWKRFLSTLNEERIVEAERSLRDMLDCESLQGRSFLDIGSGSGLFSLAAKRLGARVHSFDYDPASVRCTSELKKRFYADADDWTVERGSALDKAYLRSLGTSDVVYSWGVLHHTGDMWTALDCAALPVARNGQLFIAIYNDQDIVSVVWTKIKETYCSGALGQFLVKAVMLPYFLLQSVAVGVVRYRSPLRHFSEYKKRRGMSIYHDWIDWLGGYPFEVARPEQIFDHYTRRGFELEKLVTTNRLGCNEFVFRKKSLK